MSHYELRATLNLGEEPAPNADPYGSNGLSTEYAWEYGYDPGGFTFPSAGTVSRPAPWLVLALTHCWVRLATPGRGAELRMTGAVS